MYKFKCLTNMFISFFFLVLAGCSTIESTVKFTDTYVPSAATKMKVGTVKTDIQGTFELDINNAFSEALNRELKFKKLLPEAGSATNSGLTVNSQILEYEPGNAFKRWLCPGWGATKLTVSCMLVDPANKEIGTIKTFGNISGGGAYSIGAWKSIFDDVAKDVVAEIYKKHK